MTQLTITPNSGIACHQSCISVNQTLNLGSLPVCVPTYYPTKSPISPVISIRYIIILIFEYHNFSITSWISLVAPASMSYLSAFRDCFEGYAIYMFLGLMVSVMEDNKGLQVSFSSSL